MNKAYSLEGVQAILSYPFKTPGWQSKFAIGAAMFFGNYIIPIIPTIFLYGYFANIMRAVIVDEAEPSLPEWDDWGKLFSRGLKVFGVTFIYTLPGLVLIFGGYLLAYIPLFFQIMLSESSGAAANSLSGISILAMFVGLAMLFLGIVILIPLSLLLPPAMAHVVAKDSFLAAFRIGEWWRIVRANPWGFFTAFAVTSGAYVILASLVYILYLTIILCFLMPIGLSIIVVYLLVISAPVLGEAYRKGVENLAAANA